MVSFLWHHIWLKITFYFLAERGIYYNRIIFFLPFDAWDKIDFKIVIKNFPGAGEMALQIKCLLIFHRTRVWLSAPMLGESQSPITPPSRNLMPSSGLYSSLPSSPLPPSSLSLACAHTHQEKIKENSKIPEVL